MKYVFMSYNDNLGKFIDFLENKIKVKTNVKDYYGITYISVPKEKYLESLVAGQQIALDYEYDVRYVDIFDNAKNINYIPVLELETNESLEMENYFHNIDNLDIKIEKNKTKIKVLVKGLFRDFNKYQQLVLDYIVSNPQDFILEIQLLKIDGSLQEENSQEILENCYDGNQNKLSYHL